jgi:hypothetical protein
VEKHRFSSIYVAVSVGYRGPVFCSLIMTALTSLSAVADDYSRLQLYILGFHSGLSLII